MPALIDELLATPDNFEIVRDQIAAILKVELARQVELGLEPEPRVFVERSNPWEFVEANPIINVWFDTESFNGAASNVVARQTCDGTFNVDVYATAESKQTAQGHKPGDELAALRCQSTIRLCRQILMAAHYTYLGLRGLVGRRFPQSLTMFRAQTDERAAANVVAARLSLTVSFNEFSPQVAAVPLETLSAEVYRSESGELYLGARYPTPPSPP